MLVLKNKDGVIYNLSTKSEHNIGKFGTLKLDHASISREHASINVVVKNAELKIELQDLESKYGTYVNEGITESRKVNKISLKLGDTIKFGTCENVWTVENEQFVIYAPELSVQEKTLMTKIVNKLNGTMVTSGWRNDCTHFTTNSIKVTDKVACALAQVKPIVTVAYWKHLISVLTSKKEQFLPDYADFVPNLADVFPNSNQLKFTMNESRKTLFKDTIFVACCSKQYERVLPMIEAAGGTVVDSNTSQLTQKQLQDKIIILKPKTEQEMKAGKNYHNLVKVHRKRPVLELEILLSIADASMKRYCNPAYDVNTLFNENDNQTTVKSESTFLASDTQDIEDLQEAETGSNISLTVNDPNKIINESDDDDDDMEMLGESPAVIENSARSSVNFRASTRSATKRKLEESKETPSKYSRIDSFLTRKNHDNRGDSNGPQSTTTSSKTPPKTSMKDVFSFQNSNKTVGKSSSSLFGDVNNRPKQSSSTLFHHSDDTLGSIICDSLKKPAEVKDNFPQTRRSTRTLSLFAGLNEQTPKDSPILFSSPSERKLATNVTSEPNTSRSSKRKLPADDPGPTCSKYLFGSPLGNKKLKVTHILQDSEDDTDSCVAKDDVIFVPPTVFKKSAPLPMVDVPETVSLSQFVDVTTRNRNVKVEPLDVSGEMSELLNKTVILTVPLMKNETRFQQALEETTTYKANFKKFRKNTNLKTSTRIVPVSSFSLYDLKKEMKEDINDD